MERENSKTFTELSQEIAEKFLHTIVFVDDQAGFIERERPEKLEKPGRGGGQGKDTQKDGNGPNTHELDAKKVIDVFAFRKMVCSVLKPDKDEELLGLAIKAAEKADVLVLDWRIYDDDGEKAMGIIGNILASDPTEDQRLRLIIIYTAEDIVGISKKIQEKYSGNFRVDDEGFAFSRGHLRIAIFAKEGVGVPPDIEERVLSIDELSKQVSVEFAKITAGLVSNVALESLAVLRDNTHLIMGRLGPEMDPPYLAHRVLLPNPDDAMYHAVDIIASEFHSLLDTYEVGEKANLRTIEAWIDMKSREGTSFEVEVPNNDIKPVDLEHIREWQRVGIKKSDWWSEKNISGNKKDKFSKHGHEKLTQTFCAEGMNATELDYRFATITSFKNPYGRSERRPILTLGTVIKSESAAGSNKSEKFWLCIQPRCESVRIEKERGFFFLPLEVFDEEKDKKFDLVLEVHESEFIKLRINYKIYNSTHFEFSPEDSAEQVVRAKAENGDFVFYTADKTRSKFKWISELKTEHAQRIANDFAAKISRVGLDESEWLRRWADRRD